jgi:hypothetical protein
LIAFLLCRTTGLAVETNQFLGAQSCASSSCHGGASPKSNQNLIWSQRDPHSKSFATLVTARSERIAESLNITNAAKNARCTVCHAPFSTVPPDLAANILDPAEGVSCETCHGMAKTWLRSHTRKDFSHADKVATGMRDLRSAYDRANACVACHQNVDADILAAGHPELIFELDGQSVSEIKHWQEQTNWSGAQTWLVGQAVALREMSWRMSALTKPIHGDERAMANEMERGAGLASMIRRLDKAILGSPRFNGTNLSFTARNASNWREMSDAFARKVSTLNWTPQLTEQCLDVLLKDSPQTARAAERVALGLDRLCASRPKNTRVEAALNRLFREVQSLPDFNKTKFASALNDLANALDLDRWQKKNGMRENEGIRDGK